MFREKVILVLQIALFLLGFRILLMIAGFPMTVPGVDPWLEAMGTSIKQTGQGIGRKTFLSF